MITDQLIHAVRQQLFSTESTGVFAIVDGASVPDLRLRLYHDQPEYACLYRGELAPDMAEVAPYLVHLEAQANFTAWLLRYGWGQHWGIFAITQVDLRELHRHFRRLLTVYDSDGKPLLFRYYDPRVLRVYLPTCQPEELLTVFGPVQRYVLEAVYPRTAIRFHMVSGALQQDTLRLAQDQR